MQLAVGHAHELSYSSTFDLVKNNNGSEGLFLVG